MTADNRNAPEPGERVTVNIGSMTGDVIPSPYGVDVPGTFWVRVNGGGAVRVDVDSERWHAAPQPAIPPSTPELIEPSLAPVAVRSVGDAIRDILNPRNTLGAPRRVQP